MVGPEEKMFEMLKKYSAGFAVFSFAVVGFRMAVDGLFSEPRGLAVGC
jgi:hypothetical protein